MDEQELPFIQITGSDIDEANRLSLHCPICANPVEKYVGESELTPIVCAGCDTLYHLACWQQIGGKCAVLGCGHEKYHLFGEDLTPLLTIKYTDLQPSLNGRGGSHRTKRLKDEQRRQVEQLRRPGLLRRLFQWLLDQIKIGLTQ